MSDSRRVGMRVKDSDLKRVKFGAEPRAHDPVGLFFSLHHQQSLSEFCFLEVKYLQISSVLRLWGNVTMCLKSSLFWNNKIIRIINKVVLII